MGQLAQNAVVLSDLIMSLVPTAVRLCESVVQIANEGSVLTGDIALTVEQLCDPNSPLVTFVTELGKVARETFERRLPQWKG